MYKVIQSFVDLQDHHHSYEPGDVYPRRGYVPPEERIAELAGKANRQGVPLIQSGRKQRTKGEQNAG